MGRWKVLRREDRKCAECGIGGGGCKALFNEV